MKKIVVIFTIILSIVFCSCKSSIKTSTDSSPHINNTIPEESFESKIEYETKVAHESLNENQYVITKDIILSKQKKLTLKLYGKVLSNDYTQFGIGKIEVYDDEKLLQTLLIKDAILSEWENDLVDDYSISPFKDGNINIIDVNFDGFNDFGIFAWITTGANIPYYYWVWNDSRQKFEYSFCLCNLEVDNKNKQLISKTRSNANSYITLFYKYDKNGKLYETNHILEDYN